MSEERTPWIQRFLPVNRPERPGGEGGRSPAAALTAEQAHDLVRELEAYRAEVDAQNQRLRDRQHRLEASRERLRELYDALPLAYLTAHRDGRTLEVNRAAATMFGLDRGDLLRRRLYTLVAPEDRGAFFAHRRALFDARGTQTCEIGLRRADGSYFEGHLFSQPFVEQDAKVISFQTVIENVTARKEAERGWRLADAVIEASVEGVAVLDPHYRVMRVNRAFSRLTGFGWADVRHQPLDWLLADAGDRKRSAALARALEGDGAWAGELWLNRRDEWPFPVRATIIALRDGLRRITHYALSFDDITEARSAAEQLRQYAYYDGVTGLANRALFQEHLAQLAKEARRSGQLLGLMFLDLNRFKQINDTLGHAGGDELLQAVATRLSQCVRESDVAARVGGDEFAILLPGIDDGHGAAVIAEKIHAALAKPLVVDGTRVLCSCSVGIALYPQDTEDLETLFRYADLAMYHAKEAKRGGHRFYTSSMNAHATQRADLERELERAMDEHQLELYYQPIFAVAGEEIAGAEALLRWHHPRYGVVSPSSYPFLRVAEETGQIGPIGSWVLRSACAAAAGWHDSAPGGLPFVSINVSPQQLYDQESFRDMAGALQGAASGAAQLGIELTEHAAGGRDGIGAERLRSLRELGLRLAMDDFGTGYSSLSYLRSLPFDTLKIDQCFIHDVDAEPDGPRIVEAIVSMAHALRLKVVAEGVETAAQLEFLSGLGCDYVQGYLLSRPLPQAEFERLIGVPAPAHS